MSSSTEDSEPDYSLAQIAQLAKRKNEIQREKAAERRKAGATKGKNGRSQTALSWAAGVQDAEGDNRSRPASAAAYAHSLHPVASFSAIKYGKLSDLDTHIAGALERRDHHRDLLAETMEKMAKHNDRMKEQAQQLRAMVQERAARTIQLYWRLYRERLREQRKQEKRKKSTWMETVRARRPPRPVYVAHGGDDEDDEEEEEEGEEKEEQEPEEEPEPEPEPEEEGGGKGKRWKERRKKELEALAAAEEAASADVPADADLQPEPPPEPKEEPREGNKSRQDKRRKRNKKAARAAAAAMASPAAGSPAAAASFRSSADGSTTASEASLFSGVSDRDSVIAGPRGAPSLEAIQDDEDADGEGPVEDLRGALGSAAIATPTDSLASRATPLAAPPAGPRPAPAGSGRGTAGTAARLVISRRQEEEEYLPVADEDAEAFIQEDDGEGDVGGDEEGDIYDDEGETDDEDDVEDEGEDEEEEEEEGDGEVEGDYDEDLTGLAYDEEEEEEGHEDDEAAAAGAGAGAGGPSPHASSRSVLSGLQELMPGTEAAAAGGLGPWDEGPASVNVRRRRPAGSSKSASGPLPLWRPTGPDDVLGVRRTARRSRDPSGMGSRAAKTAAGGTGQGQIDAVGYDAAAALSFALEPLQRDARNIPSLLRVLEPTPAAPGRGQRSAVRPEDLGQTHGSPRLAAEASGASVLAGEEPSSSASPRLRRAHSGGSLSLPPPSGVDTEALASARSPRRLDAALAAAAEEDPESASASPYGASDSERVSPRSIAPSAPASPRRDAATAAAGDATATNTAVETDAGGAAAARQARSGRSPTGLSASPPRTRSRVPAGRAGGVGDGSTRRAYSHSSGLRPAVADLSGLPAAAAAVAMAAVAAGEAPSELTAEMSYASARSHRSVAAGGVGGPLASERSAPALLQWGPAATPSGLPWRYRADVLRDVFCQGQVDPAVLLQRALTPPRGVRGRNMVTPQPQPLALPVTAVAPPGPQYSSLEEELAERMEELLRRRRRSAHLNNQHHHQHSHSHGQHALRRQHSRSPNRAASPEGSSGSAQLCPVVTVMGMGLGLAPGPGPSHPQPWSSPQNSLSAEPSRLTCLPPGPLLECVREAADEEGGSLPPSTCGEAPGPARSATESGGGVVLAVAEAPRELGVVLEVGRELAAREAADLEQHGGLPAVVDGEQGHHRWSANTGGESGPDWQAGPGLVAVAGRPGDVGDSLGEAGAAVEAAGAVRGVGSGGGGWAGGEEAGTAGASAAAVGAQRLVAHAVGRAGSPSGGSAANGGRGGRGSPLPLSPVAGGPAHGHPPPANPFSLPLPVAVGLVPRARTSSLAPLVSSEVGGVVPGATGAMLRRSHPPAAGADGAAAGASVPEPLATGPGPLPLLSQASYSSGVRGSRELLEADGPATKLPPPRSLSMGTPLAPAAQRLQPPAPLGPPGPLPPPAVGALARASGSAQWRPGSPDGRTGAAATAAAAAAAALENVTERRVPPLRAVAASSGRAHGSQALRQVDVNLVESPASGNLEGAADPLHPPPQLHQQHSRTRLLPVPSPLAPPAYNRTDMGYGSPPYGADPGDRGADADAAAASALRLAAVISPTLWAASHPSHHRSSGRAASMRLPSPTSRPLQLYGIPASHQRQPPPPTQQQQGQLQQAQQQPQQQQQQPQPQQQQQQQPSPAPPAQQQPAGQPGRTSPAAASPQGAKPAPPPPPPPPPALGQGQGLAVAPHFYLPQDRAGMYDDLLGPTPWLQRVNTSGPLPPTAIDPAAAPAAPQQNLTPTSTWLPAPGAPTFQSQSPPSVGSRAGPSYAWREPGEDPVVLAPRGAAGAEQQQLRPTGPSLAAPMAAAAASSSPAAIAAAAAAATAAATRPNAMRREGSGSLGSVAALAGGGSYGLPFVPPPPTLTTRLVIHRPAPVLRLPVVAAAQQAAQAGRVRASYGNPGGGSTGSVASMAVMGTGVVAGGVTPSAVLGSAGGHHPPMTAVSWDGPLTDPRLYGNSSPPGPRTISPEPSYMGMTGSSIATVPGGPPGRPDSWRMPPPPPQVTGGQAAAPPPPAHGSPTGSSRPPYSSPLSMPPPTAAGTAASYLSSEALKASVVTADSIGAAATASAGSGVVPGAGSKAALREWRGLERWWQAKGLEDAGQLHRHPLHQTRSIYL